MGGGSSKQGRKEKHFYFGEVVKKKEFGKYMIVVSNMVLNKEECAEWEQKYKKSHDMNKESLLIPQNFEQKKLQTSVAACNCCGAESQIEMTYEDTAFSLHQQIANRKSKKQFYSEEELIFLFYQMLQGSKQFQIKNMRLGDIRTKNILITRSDSIKMVNVVSFPDEKTAVDKILYKYDNSTVFFLAPQEIDFVKNKSKSKDAIPNAKTEAWAIGLCGLEAATLQNSEQLYQMPGRSFKQEALVDRMGLVRDKYPHFYHFLESVLRQGQSQRMSSGECWAMMRPYSESITELKKFKRNPQVQNEQVRKFLSGGSLRK